MKSYKVRIWDLAHWPHRKSPYGVRWTVQGKQHSSWFTNKTPADRYRGKLLTAIENGEPFDTETGLPDSLAAGKGSMTWYELALAYVDAKWPMAAANSRVSIAETMTAVTMAYVGKVSGRPNSDVLRAALRGYAFNPSKRGRTDQPADITAALKWVAKASRPLRAMAEDSQEARKILDSFTVLLDGSKASASTISRKRRVFYNALEYAVTTKKLPANPLPSLDWKAPKASGNIDRRVVVSPAQMRELLTAVSYVGSYHRARGRRLVAFYACFYFAMMRPAELVGLKASNCHLPDEGWGLLLLSDTRPAVGKSWTDNGETHDERGLKQRDEWDTRPVPIPPELVKILKAHLEEFGTADDGRVFTNERGGLVGSSTYYRVWAEARTYAFPPDKVASKLAARPYDLRHGGVSLGLNGTADPTDVAERAGHSVETLLRVYAKCIDGRRDANNKLIEDRLNEGAAVVDPPANSPRKDVGRRRSKPKGHWQG